MRPNRIRQIWAEGGCVTLGWLVVASTFTAEVMARQGFDSLCVDLQHGLLDYQDLWPMLQAISQTETVPLVRVPSNDAAIIMKALDAGAYGVVVPLVNTETEAQAAVSACRYPPLGTRSYGPIRASLYGGADYAERANDEIVVFAMIETRQGLDHLDEICSTEGLDGIYIGPADLCFALGLPPSVDSEHPLHLETCDRIRDAAHRHGKRAAMHTYDPRFAARAVERGFDMVMLTSDLACMRSAVKSHLAAFHDALSGLRVAAPRG